MALMISIQEIHKLSRQVPESSVPSDAIGRALGHYDRADSPSPSATASAPLTLRLLNSRPFFIAKTTYRLDLRANVQATQFDHIPIDFLEWEQESGRESVSRFGGIFLAGDERRISHQIGVPVPGKPSATFEVLIYDRKDCEMIH